MSATTINRARLTEFGGNVFIDDENVKTAFADGTYFGTGTILRVPQEDGESIYYEVTGRLAHPLPGWLLHEAPDDPLPDWPVIREADRRPRKKRARPT